MDRAPIIDIVEYVDGVHGNSRNTLDSYPAHRAHLQAVSDSFTALLNLEGLKAGPIVLFSMAHSSFLSSAQLATGGQFSTAYMAARGCLEAALYGFAMVQNPSLKKIWSHRDDSDAANKACREAFRVGPFKKMLEGANATVAKQWSIAYDITIDLGAHPNSGAFWTNLEETDSTDTLFQYVHTEATSLKQAMSTASFSGVTALTLALITFPGETGGIAPSVVHLYDGIAALTP